MMGWIMHARVKRMLLRSVVAGGAGTGARRRRRVAVSLRRAFTLIEVLVSISIVALISMLIFGAFTGMARSRDNMRAVTERYQQGRNAIDRMARELGAAFISGHKPFGQVQFQRETAFVGSDQRPADRVDFTAFANVRLGRDSHQSDQAELSYFAAKNPDTGGIDLVRRIQHHIDSDPTKGGVVQVMVENIDSFDVKYMDPLTNEWVDSWDTTQAAGQPARLPSYVWIRLVLIDHVGEPSVVFQTKTNIPMQLPLNFARQ